MFKDQLDGNTTVNFPGKNNPDLFKCPRVILQKILKFKQNSALEDFDVLLTG